MTDSSGGPPVAELPARGRYVITEGDVQADKAEVLDLGARNLPDAPREARFDKYFEDNPFGPPFFLLARDRESDELVGMATVFPAQMWVAGRPVAASIGGDFAVDPRHRGFGPALPLQRALLSRLPERGLACAYGVPNPFSEAVIARTGYAEVSPLTRFVKVLRSRLALERYVRRPRLARLLSAVGSAVVDPLLPVVFRERRSAGGGEFTVERPEAFDDRFTRVWEDLRKRYPITVERNAEVLNWKYERGAAARPASPYSILAVVDRENRVAGYVVWKVIDGVRHVFDLGCLDSQPAIDALLSEFLMDARRDRAAGITFMRLAPDDLLAARLRSFGFVSGPADWRLRVYRAGELPGGVDVLDPANWHYTLGDADA